MSETSEILEFTHHPVVGIIGAGRAGTAIARVARAAGIEIDICSTRAPKALQHHLKIYAPGARPVWPEQVAQRTQRDGPGVLVLAVPQEDLDEINPDWVQGTVLIDATNTWHDELLPGWLQAAVAERLPTSMAIAGHFPGAQVVKALNHVSHLDLESAAGPQQPLTQRRALAVAGDDPTARGSVMNLLAEMGFDPVSVGPLAAGRVMEPDGPLFNRQLRRADVLRWAR